MFPAPLLIVKVRKPSAPIPLSVIVGIGTPFPLPSPKITEIFSEESVKVKVPSSFSFIERELKPLETPPPVPPPVPPLVPPPVPPPVLFIRFTTTSTTSPALKGEK